MAEEVPDDRWVSHVEATISASHSNGPPGQKCYNTHGHDWKVEVQCTYYKVDEYGWGPNFGAIKAIIRTYDHDDLNKLMDEPPSAENFARKLYYEIADAINQAPDWVRVHEAGGNWVEYHDVPFTFGTDRDDDEEGLPGSGDLRADDPG